MAELLRVGIIGYGRMGEIHAEVWTGIPQARLAAIADPDPKRWQLAFERYSRNGCKIFGFGVEMLDAVPLDVVVVATQAPDHCRNVLLAMEHGCHVICEKPIALTLEEADVMVDAARRSSSFLAVHHQTVFTDAVVCAKAMRWDGEIGKLYYIEGWCKGRPAPYDLMEVGGHVLHLILDFAVGYHYYWPIGVFGDVRDMNRETLWHDASSEDARPIEELYPQGRPCGMDVGDYIFGYYKFKNGIRAALRLATLDSESSEFMAVELHGTKGRLRIHQTETGRLFFKPTPHDTFDTMAWQEVKGVWNPDPKWIIPVRRFAEDFLDAIRKKREPAVPEVTGRLVLEMTLGIYASHFAGKSLNIPLEDRKCPFVKK